LVDIGRWFSLETVASATQMQTQPNKTQSIFTKLRPARWKYSKPIGIQREVEGRKSINLMTKSMGEKIKIKGVKIHISSENRLG